jgi:hypothetical protein
MGVTKIKKNDYDNNMSLIFEKTEGYNWCSFNIEGINLSTFFENIPKPTQLYNGMSTSGLVVYTQTGAIVWQLESTSPIFGYIPARWSADIVIDYKQTYIIHLHQNVNITINNISYVSKTIPMTIENRFSWIGYYGEDAQSISEAFSLLSKPTTLQLGDTNSGLIVYSETGAIVWQLESTFFLQQIPAKWSNKNFNMQQGNGYILKVPDDMIGSEIVYSFNDATTQNVVSNGKFSMNGYSQAEQSILRNKTYNFDQSDGSNATHPLRISKVAEGSQMYTEIEGVVTNESLVSFKAGPYEEDVTYYYCGNHTGMGSSINVYPKNESLKISSVTSTGNTNEYTAEIIFSNDGLISEYVTGMQMYFEQIQITEISEWSSEFDIPEGVADPEAYMATSTTDWKVTKNTFSSSFNEDISVIIIEYLTAGNPTFKDTKMFKIKFVKTEYINSLSFMYRSDYKTMISDENAEEHPIKLGSIHHFDTLQSLLFTTMQTLATDKYTSNFIRAKPTQHNQEVNMFVTFALNLSFGQGDIVIAVEDSLINSSNDQNEYVLGWAELNETDNIHNICVYKTDVNSLQITYKYYDVTTGNVYDIRNNPASVFDESGYGTFTNPILFVKEDSISTQIN